MIRQVGSPLEQMLRDCGLGWMIDSHNPPEQALPYWNQALDEADAEASRRFGQQAPRLTADALAAEYQANSHKVEALLQTLGKTSSPQLLVMAWRILQGMGIANVELTYEMRTKFHLRVRLTNPINNEKETYESNSIIDAAALRHFGIATIDHAPLFDGYYPLRLP